MIVEMNRDSKLSIDDAHELNMLICKSKNLSDAFKLDWHQAYQAYCRDREGIRLTQGIEQ